MIIRGDTCGDFQKHNNMVRYIIQFWRMKKKLGYFYSLLRLFDRQTRLDRNDGLKQYDF